MVEFHKPKVGDKVFIYGTPRHGEMDKQGRTLIVQKEDTVVKVGTRYFYLEGDIERRGTEWEYAKYRYQVATGKREDNWLCVWGVDDVQAFNSKEDHSRYIEKLGLIASILSMCKRSVLEGCTVEALRDIKAYLSDD